MAGGVVIAGLVASVVSLFLPWEIAGTPLPAGDARAQLVTATVLGVLAGVLALSYPTRVTTLIAAGIAVVPATDVGPVFRPEGEGGYGPGAYVAVVAGVVLGATWLIQAAARAPHRPLSGVWLLMPAFGAATLAGATLPWAVVSEVGSTSGPRSAWQLLLGGEPNLPPGYLLTRIVAIAVVLLAAGGTVAALVFAQRAAALAAAVACGLAAAGTLVLQFWLAASDDAVAPADGAPGIRIAVVGFAVLSLLWMSQAHRRQSPSAIAEDELVTGTGVAVAGTPLDEDDDYAPAERTELDPAVDALSALESADRDSQQALRPVRHTIITGGVQRQLRHASTRPSTPAPAVRR